MRDLDRIGQPDGNKVAVKPGGEGFRQSTSSRGRCGLCVKKNKGRSGCDVGNFAEVI